ncbi:MAG: NADPH-dependent assimilatory sulfite reductase hemoprotein subunit, partial [Planctomycetota bacterium]
MSTEAPKLSPVEGHKSESHLLRGTIALEMAQGHDHFGEADKSLIKFHGFYQQDDRDARKTRQKDGPAKLYIFMVRCKIPGGKVTAEQYLALDKLCEQYANDTLRITSRQGFQFHGVRMPGLKAIIADINKTLLTTLGACGDVNRNVMAPPAPIASPLYE